MPVEEEAAAAGVAAAAASGVLRTVWGSGPGGLVRSAGSSN